MRTEAQDQQLSKAKYSGVQFECLYDTSKGIKSLGSGTNGE